MTKWRAIGHSQRGESHIKQSIPNQDAFAYHPWMESENMVLAVADGHGSSKCIRSHWGAQFAVNSAVHVFSQLMPCDAESQPLNTTQIKRRLELELPKQVLKKWQTYVDQFHSHHPLQQEESVFLEKNIAPEILSSLKQKVFTFYGTTLLVVFLTKNFIVFTQIGDGDILCISENGDVTRPFKKDPRFIANETDSLSNHNALGLMKFHFFPITEWSPAPKMILLSSDGLSNAYKDDQAFELFASDICTILEKGQLGDQILFIEQNLENWLNEASKYSGDDITLGILFRPDAFFVKVKKADIEEKSTRTEKPATAMADNQEE